MRSYTSWLQDLGAAVSQSIEKHEGSYLLAMLLVFALVSSYQDRITPLWFDELFTLFVSRLSSLQEMMRAMPSDGQPPLQYLLTHTSMQLFGVSEVAIRLPELLAYLAAGWLTFKIVRRHGTASQALFAAALLLGSRQCLDSLSARPYELLLVFTGLLYLGWQRAAIAAGRRLLPLFAVILGTGGAILSHHFGVIYAVVLLGAGESVRIVERRKLDGAMLAAIAAGLTPLAVTVPLARQSSLLLGDAVRHSATFWAKPAVANLSFYSWMAARPLLAIAALLGLLLWAFALLKPAVGPGTESVDSELPVPAHEWAAAGALCLLIPIQWLVARVATGYFLSRYAIGTALGAALLCAWGLPRLPLIRRVAGPALAMSTICFLLFTAGRLLLDQTRQPAWRAMPSREAVPEMLKQAPGDLPIVVASAYEYAPVWWYSPPAIQKRLTYLYDVPYAVRQQDFLPELSLVTGQGFIPLRISAFAPFLASHSRFVLYRAGRERLEWVAPRLWEDGWRLTPISATGDRELLLVER